MGNSRDAMVQRTEEALTDDEGCSTDDEFVDCSDPDDDFVLLTLNEVPSASPPVSRPDEQKRTTCALCDAEFSRWSHPRQQCECCQRLICGPCLPHAISLPHLLDTPTLARACNECYSQAMEGTTCKHQPPCIAHQHVAQVQLLQSTSNCPRRNRPRPVR